MSKRQATEYLTSDGVLDRDPRDDGDDAEPSGEFRRADADVLRSRPIAAPKRRAIGTPATASKPGGGLFAGLAFGTPSNVPLSTPTKSSATTAPPFAGFSFTQASAPPPISSVPAPVNSASVEAISSAAAAPESLTSKSELEFAKSLRGLNLSFQTQVATTLKTDAFADLSSLFEQYQTHRSSILAKNSDVATKLSGQTSGLSQLPASSNNTETLKPGGKAPSAPNALASFATAPSGWTCDVCLVGNTVDKSKCVACESPKPGAEPAAVKSSSLFSSASAASSKWTCDSCLVVNDADKSKCIACESAKPGLSMPASNAVSSSSFFGGSDAATQKSFQFSSPSSGGFSFGKPGDAKTPFGDGSGAPVLSFGKPLDSNATVGFGKTSSEANANVGGFNFSKTVEPKNAESSDAPVVGGFSFSKTVESKNAESSDVPVASFGFSKSEEPSTSSATNFNFTKPPSFASPGNTLGSVSFGFGKAPESAAPSMNLFQSTSTKADSSEPKETSSDKSKPSSERNDVMKIPPATPTFGFGSSSATQPPSSSNFSFGGISQTSTSAFGGFGSLNTPPSFGGTKFSFGGFSSAPTVPKSDENDGKAEDGNDGEEDEAPPDEQIDTTKLMRGAGEESEETLFEQTSKAHVFNKDEKAWKDVGRGVLKVNRNTETKSGRLILRADGIGRVLLNLAIFDGMGLKVEQGKCVTFLGAAESGGLQKFMCRFKDATTATQFLEAVSNVVKEMTQ
ncbi:hypothetical protein HDU83_006063 [Entophlyctis luteolus]|nr:hypothetical protein HDU83_006063 [Entophlyctis luteolus]